MAGKEKEEKLVIAGRGAGRVGVGMLMLMVAGGKKAAKLAAVVVEAVAVDLGLTG